MKAVVWHALGDIRLDDVPEPTIKDPYDASVRITTLRPRCGAPGGLRSRWPDGTVLRR